MEHLQFEVKMELSTQNKFIKYCKFLETMTNEARSNICELIFCMRDGIFSTVIVFNNKETFLSVLGDYPPEINLIQARRYYIDIESLGSDKIRIYNCESDNLILTGYYLNNNSVYEIKKYKRTDSPKIINIDRYNANGEIISKNEEEVECDISDWTGPNELVSIAIETNLLINVMKKTNKNQTYLRVRRNPNFSLD